MLTRTSECICVMIDDLSLIPAFGLTGAKLHGSKSRWSSRKILLFWEYEMMYLAPRAVMMFVWFVLLGFKAVLIVEVQKINQGLGKCREPRPHLPT